MKQESEFKPQGGDTVELELTRLPSLRQTGGLQIPEEPLVLPVPFRPPLPLRAQEQGKGSAATLHTVPCSWGPAAVGCVWQEGNPSPCGLLPAHGPSANEGR